MNTSKQVVVKGRFVIDPQTDLLHFVPIKKILTPRVKAAIDRLETEARKKQRGQYFHSNVTGCLHYIPFERDNLINHG